MINDIGYPSAKRQAVIIFMALFVGILITLAFEYLPTQHQHHNFEGPVAYVKDVDQTLTLTAILKQSIDWQHTTKQNFNPGITPHPYWLKFDLPEMSESRDWILQIGYPLLDDIQIWVLQDSTVIDYYKTGDSLLFEQRPIASNQFVFPIQGQQTAPQTLVIRLATTSSFKLPLSLWPAANYAVFSGEYNLLIGLLLGTFIAIGLNSLFFWSASTRPTFLSYGAYVILLAASLFANYGYGYKYLWPNSPFFQDVNILILGYSAILAGLVFTYYFLEVENESRRLSTLLKLWSVGILAAMLMCLLMPYQTMLVLLVVMLLLTGGISLMLGVVCLIRGNPFAKIYIIAWSAILIAAIIYASIQLGFIPYSSDPHIVFIAGAVTENLIFAFTLASSYHQQREKAHERQIERESELEDEVKDRSWELEIALRELAEKNVELERLTTIDALTNCHNRRYFDKKHIAEIRRSRRLDDPLCLAMIDIDNFKVLNDTYGHLAGDECLKQVSSLLKSKLQRSTDMLFRYGGEEFSVLMPATDSAGSVRVLEDIRQAIADEEFTFDNQIIKVTVSIGFCSGVIQQNSADNALLSVADQALYMAKHQGRNKVLEGSLEDHQAVTAQSQERYKLGI